MRKILTLACLLLTITVVKAQKKEEKKDFKKEVYVKFKDSKKPVVYVDGKKFDFSIELIDQSKIESVHVLKDEKAKKEYNAPYGVVLILTKEGEKSGNIYDEVENDTKVFSNKKSPMVIIDGKVSNQKTLKKYKSEEIESIEILKGEKAKKYNAPYGVVLVKTKKKKS